MNKLIAFICSALLWIVLFLVISVIGTIQGYDIPVNSVYRFSSSIAVVMVTFKFYDWLVK